MIRFLNRLEVADYAILFGFIGAVAVIIWMRLG
jgi:hypothetical protein